MSDVDQGGDCTCGARGVREISVPSTQFSFVLECSDKIKSILKKAYNSIKT